MTLFSQLCYVFFWRINSICCQEEIDIDLEENQGTIHAVKTKAHLHIPMASGNVIKIPLAAIQEPSHNINISNEVNQSGLWKHIASESHMSCSKEGDDKYATYLDRKSVV